MEAYAQSYGQHIPLYVAPSYFVDHSISPEVLVLGILCLFILGIFAIILHAIHFLYLSIVRGVRLGIEVYVAGWLLSFTSFGRSFFRRK